MYQTEACCPIFAPLVSESAESGCTYGTGIILGELMNVNYKKTYAEAPLYGDNKLTDYEREVTGGDITLNATWLPFSAANAMFGSAVANGNQRTTVRDCGVKFGGYGYTKKCKRNGTVVYVAKWIYKAFFTEPDDTVTTKQGNLQINTPSISGKAFVPADGNCDDEWEFSTLAEALNKIKTLANINSSSFVAQPFITPDNDSGISASTNIYLACHTPGATIYYTTDGTAPTNESSEYTAPFTISASGTVKAIAYASGNASAVSSKSYTV